MNVLNFPIRKSTDVGQFTPEWWEPHCDPNTWDEEGRKHYLGKYFYEVVRVEERYLRLYGPLRGLYYLTHSVDGEGAYVFVQVADCKIVASFTEKEILVSDRLL